MGNEDCRRHKPYQANSKEEEGFTLVVQLEVPRNKRIMVITIYINYTKF